MGLANLNRSISTPLSPKKAGAEPAEEQGATNFAAFAMLKRPALSRAGSFLGKTNSKFQEAMTEKEKNADSAYTSSAFGTKTKRSAQRFVFKPADAPRDGHEGDEAKAKGKPGLGPRSGSKRSQSLIGKANTLSDVGDLAVKRQRSSSILSSLNRSGFSSTLSSFFLFLLSFSRIPLHCVCDSALVLTRMSVFQLAYGVSRHGARKQRGREEQRRRSLHDQRS
jgi:hypothetical protein